MTKVVTQGIFPSQSVPDIEKASSEYGMQVAKAIESEWFKTLKKILIVGFVFGLPIFLVGVTIWIDYGK